jgi:hypothetical protein
MRGCSSTGNNRRVPAKLRDRLAVQTAHIPMYYVQAKIKISAETGPVLYL